MSINHKEVKIMPGMNGTGPQGSGPMTGRRMGKCASAAGVAPHYGYGMGRGHGRGMGYRRFNDFQELTPEQHKEMLAERKSFLEKELAGINDQIEKL